MKNWRSFLMTIIFSVAGWSCMAALGHLLLPNLHGMFIFCLECMASLSLGYLGYIFGLIVDKRAEINKQPVRIKDLSPYDNDL